MLHICVDKADILPAMVQLDVSNHQIPCNGLQKRDAQSVRDHHLTAINTKTHLNKHHPNAMLKVQVGCWSNAAFWFANYCMVWNICRELKLMRQSGTLQKKLKNHCRFSDLASTRLWMLGAISPCNVGRDPRHWKSWETSLPHLLECPRWWWRRRRVTTSTNRPVASPQPPQPPIVAATPEATVQTHSLIGKTILIIP